MSDAIKRLLVLSLVFVAAFLSVQISPYARYFHSVNFTLDPSTFLTLLTNSF